MSTRQSKFSTILLKQILVSKFALSMYLCIKLLLCILSVVLPLLFAKTVDSLIVRNIKEFYSYSIVFLSLTVIFLVLKYYSSILNIKLDSTLVFKCFQDTLEEYFKLSLSVLSKYDPNYIASRINSDSMTIVSFIINNSIDTLFGIIQSIIIVLVVIKYSIAIFITILIMLPACAIIFYYYKDRTKNLVIKTKEISARYSASYIKQCSGYLFIKMNGLYQISRKFVEKYFHQTLNGFLEFRRIGSRTDLFTSLIQLGATAFLIFFGGKAVFSETMTIGTFTAINSYLATLIAITGSFVVTGRMVIQTTESLKRMNEILNNEIENNIGKKQLEKIESIHLGNIVVAVDDKKTVSIKLNVELVKGKVYCISGENGSGKSTLIKTICGGYHEYTGSILLNGIELKEIDLVHYKSNLISFLPQLPNIFFESSDDIISMGGLIENVEKVNQYLKQLLRVEEPIEFLNERLSNNGSSVENRFSGGEKQKIAFACACSRECEILVLDEPTSAVDTESAMLITEILKDIAKDKIVLCVSHDNELLQKADYVLTC